MTDRHMPNNADLTYFTVTCHLAPVVADISQDSDYDPNVDRRIDAVVTFTPKYKTGEVIHAHDALPPTGFLVMPVTALIDDGYLKLRVKPDAGAAPLPGTLHGLKAKIAKDTGKELPVQGDVRALNYAPVRLLGNSATLEIDPDYPLYYDFSFSQVKVDGKATNLTITGGTFEAPWADEVIDLLDYMPLTPGPYAQPMVVGPPGPQGPAGEPGPATVDVGSTTTSAPGTDAVVTNGGDNVNAVFDFVIPRGADGPAGPQGPAGVIPAGTELQANKGVAGGYTPLDAGAKVEAKYLPSYVDDVLEFPTQADFSQPGTAGVIYVDVATNKCYRWSGSAYILISNAEIPGINTYPAKTAPVDADEFPLSDSADTFKSKKITWANLKTAIAAWYNPLVATVTNKTMSGKQNTFTDIPSSATPDASRLVCLTAGGGTTADNGANTWAKVASFESTTSTATLNLVLAMVGLRHGLAATDAVILSVGVNIQSASANPVAAISVIAGGGTRSFSPDSFKITNDGFGTPVQLWVRKGINYGSVSVYEVARNSSTIPLADMAAGVDTGDITADDDIKSAETAAAAGVDTGDIEAAALIAGWTVTYHNSAPWQSAVPTGTVTNVQTELGSYVFGQLISTRQAATAYSMTFA